MLGKRAWMVFSVLVLSCLVRPLWAQSAPGVSARLSAAQIGFEESVALEVLARGLDGPLDTSELEQSFDITGRSESQQVRIVNGVNDSLRQWVLQLMPRRSGRLTVPPVRVAGVASEPLILDVGDAPTGADRVVFIEMGIDVESPWVQQQVYLSLRVFHRIPLERYQISTPDIDGVTVLPIDGELTRTEERDGVMYNVLEKRFALFPQESGEVAVPPFVLTALVPADPARVRTLLSPTRRVTRRTDPTLLNVRARPADVTAAWWLPSRSIELSEEWQSELDEATVGEPISRVIRVRAEGVLATQLPSADTPDVDGVSVYIDEPDDTTVAEVDGLITERVTSWAVIPQRAGRVELPAVDIEWFDTTAGVERVARLPAQVIDVAEAAPVAGDVPVEADLASAANVGANDLATGVPAASDNPSPQRLEADANHSDASRRVWRGVALVALLGWLLTGLAWGGREIRARRQSAVSDDAIEERTAMSGEVALQDLRAAAQRGDLAAAAEAVRAWVRATGHGAGGSLTAARVAPNLTSIAEDLDHAPIAADLRALDAHLYGSSMSRMSQSLALDLDRVHRHLSALGQEAGARQQRQTEAALPAL